MRRDEAIARLKSADPDIRAFGVGKPHLFGSVARDEAKAGSDIDVFVEPSTNAFYNLRNLKGVYRQLLEIFPGLEIGYCTREDLSRVIRPDVEREAICVV